jgi:hypothetical protein
MIKYIDKNLMGQLTILTFRSMHCKSLVFPLVSLEMSAIEVERRVVVNDEILLLSLELSRIVQ